MLLKSEIHLLLLELVRVSVDKHFRLALTVRFWYGRNVPY